MGDAFFDYDTVYIFTFAHVFEWNQLDFDILGDIDGILEVKGTSFDCVDGLDHKVS